MYHFEFRKIFIVRVILSITFFLCCSAIVLVAQEKQADFEKELEKELEKTGYSEDEIKKIIERQKKRKNGQFKLQEHIKELKSRLIYNHISEGRIQEIIKLEVQVFEETFSIKKTSEKKKMAMKLREPFLLDLLREMRILNEVIKGENQERYVQKIKEGWEQWLYKRASHQRFVVEKIKFLTDLDFLYEPFFEIASLDEKIESSLMEKKEVVITKTERLFADLLHLWGPVVSATDKERIRALKKGEVEMYDGLSHFMDDRRSFTANTKIEKRKRKYYGSVKKKVEKFEKEMEGHVKTLHGVVKRHMTKKSYSIEVIRLINEALKQSKKMATNLNCDYLKAPLLLNMYIVADDKVEIIADDKVILSDLCEYVKYPVHEKNIFADYDFTMVVNVENTRQPQPSNGFPVLSWWMKGRPLSAMPGLGECTAKKSM